VFKILGVYKRNSEYEFEVRSPSCCTDYFRHPFHAQLEDLNQPHMGPMHQQSGSDVQSFDLRQMASNLPTNSEHSSFETRRPSAQYNVAGMMGTSSFQYPQQMAQHGQQRHDLNNYARAQQHQQHQQHQDQQQQQHYAPQQMVPQAAQYQYNRSHPLQMHAQAPFPRMDPYAYGVSPSSYSPVDMRFPQQAFPMGYGPPGGYQDMSRLAIYVAIGIFY
jgi:hypothetical protein